MRILKRPFILRGGRAEGMYIEDFDREQLAIGLQHELEHTRDRNVALIIAADHLAKDKNYYRKLEEAGL